MSAPVAIPFPLSNAPGSHGQEASGRIINAYPEPLGDTAVSKVKYPRAPGLASFATSSQSGFRGGIEVNGTFYAAFDSKLYKCSSSGGAMSLVGTLNGTKRGFFARNNAATPDKVFVDPDGNIATFTTSAVTNSFDADVPSANSVTHLDGYFILTIADGRFFVTDLNAVTVNALSFGKAEAKADGLVRGIAYRGQLFLFGNYSLEIWTDAGLIPMPFTRSFVIQRGLAGPYCVAGHEDGFGNALIWVGDDNAVYQLDGNAPLKISPPDLDTLIEATTDKTTLDASVYISRGHAFWQLSSATWTWVFDLNTQKWHERESYGLTRSRMISSAYAFGQKWLCGDTQSGNIIEITSTALDEIGQPLRWRIESGPVEKFPTGSRVGRADFNFVTGVGQASGNDPTQTDPTVEVSWSDDGGQNWSPPVPQKLGRQSETSGLVSLVSCTGRSSWNGRRWRLDVTDAVYVALMGGTQAENPRPMG